MEKKCRRHRKDWYDTECRETRKEVRSYLAKFRNSRNETNRKKYTDSRRTLKKLIEKKKQDREEENWEQVEKSKDTKECWKAIKKYRQRKNNLSNDMNEEQWLTQFKQLLEAGNDSEAEARAKDTSYSS